MVPGRSLKIIIRNASLGTLEYNSGNGFVNSLGFAFGIVMLFIAFIIFTSEPEEKHYDWEDEDENKDSLSKDSSDNAE